MTKTRKPRPTISRRIGRQATNAETVGPNKADLNWTDEDHKTKDETK